MKSNDRLEFIYKITDWLLLLLFVNLLLGATSIVPAMLIIYYGKGKSLLIVSFLVICITFLLFFPTTTAVLSIIRQFILKERKLSIIKHFWIYFKDNYIKSIIGGVFVVFLWVIFLVDFYFFYKYISKLFVVPFFILFIILFVYTFYLFLSIAHFNAKLKELFKNSLFLTLGNIPITFVIGIATLIIIYASFFHLLFLVPLFSFSVIMLMLTYGFLNTVTKKVKEKTPNN